MSEHGPIDLSRTPVHLPSIADDAPPAQALPWFAFDEPSFGKYVQEHCSAASPGRLLMVETSPSDWPSWERHTEGDEIVIIVEGTGTFHQRFGDETHSSPFVAGDTFINPRGVWHTADVTSPMRAIYLTPCPGTEHEPRNQPG
jgi:uncharacterized cupin superfamily protein